MKLLVVLTFFIFTFACSNATEYSGDNTNVVITKNPKGNTDETTTKQLKLTAPWLDDSTELELVPAAIASYNATGEREVVGTFDPGTTLLISKNRSITIQFDILKTSEEEVKTLQVELEQASLKNKIRTVGAISGKKILRLSLTGLNSSNLYEFFIAPAKAVGNGQCDLRQELSQRESNKGSTVLCGAKEDIDDDSEDDNDDDNDDDRGND